MKNKIPFKDIMIIGFMSFALFFGAGNLVFPPMLGQSAGSYLWPANAGFLITGVGLPLIGVLAIGFSGKEDLLSLASRVHPIFGLIFTTVLYLTIGPLFAIPRTGSVSYEIGVKPFLPQGSGLTQSLVFTLIYFGIACIFSLNPSRVIDIVGKVLTPVLIIFIGILAIAVLTGPIGDLAEPSSHYRADAFFVGFQEGYLTMDTLASFVFGIIIIRAIRQKGAETKKQTMRVCVQATAISALILALIYSFLSYLGAISAQRFGLMNNGGTVLTTMSDAYFGTFGGLVLGTIVISACLTTSIGLTTTCSAYLNRLIPAVSYRAFVIGQSVFCAVLTNIGLNELIAISVPVLAILYPLSIVLIIFTFLHPVFKRRNQVYLGSLLLTLLVSLADVLDDSGVHLWGASDWLSGFLPFYDIGLGWVIPAALGALLGYMLSWVQKRSLRTE